jgi:hypothetical protein
LQDANDYYETHRRRESEKLKKAQQKEVLKLAKDFPRLWKNPRTPVREKKRMIRFLIEDVTMIRKKRILRFTFDLKVVQKNVEASTSPQKLAI